MTYYFVFVFFLYISLFINPPEVLYNMLMNVSILFKHKL